MKLGASSWPFQWDPPYEDVIRRVAGLGFAAIELIAWNKDHLRDHYTKDRIVNLKSVLGGEGIALSQFVSTPLELSSPEKDRREAAVEHWKRATEVGAELGSPIINMVSAYAFALRDGVDIPRIKTRPLVQKYAAHVPSGLDWDQNFRDYVAALKQCAAACEAAGVLMTIEPHPARYVANTAGALRLLEHVGSDTVGINFDPSHTFAVGDFPNVSVYQLGKRIKHCHVSDNDGVTNVHWRPGLGKIDWRAMFQALKDVGYDGVISIELEDVPGVSRPPHAPGIVSNKTATDEFVAETLAAKDYLESICRELGIAVQ